MKKPWREIQVLNSIYRVFRLPKLFEQGYEGLCEPHQKRIVIDQRLKGEDLRRTLMHELVHAYQAESGLIEILDAQAREMHAETMAGFICEVIKRKF